MSSERLIIAAGDVIRELCSCLLPENVEMLIFIKYNLTMTPSTGAQEHLTTQITIKRNIKYIKMKNSVSQSALIL